MPWETDLQHNFLMEIYKDQSTNEAEQRGEADPMVISIAGDGVFREIYKGLGNRIKSSENDPWLSGNMIRQN